MDPKTSGVQSGRDGVQGEGNYDASRRYDEGVKRSLEKGNTEELAEKAKRALEGPEGDELREAEKAGKEGTPGTESGKDEGGANKPVST